MGAKWARRLTTTPPKGLYRLGTACVPKFVLENNLTLLMDSLAV